MELLGYSERGFVNAFFYNLLGSAEPSPIVRGLLTLVRWPLQSTSPVRTDLVTPDLVLVEQSFSDFGDADAVLLCSSANEKVAFFCEAKRGRSWRIQREWEQFQARFQNGLPGGHSNLFRQLYLKQKFAAAVVAGDDIDTGIEFDGVLRPNRGTRRRKIGRNPVVLRAVEKVRPYLAQSFYLILTPEPWRDDLRLAFQDIQSFGQPPNGPSPRNWDVSNWGVLPLPDMLDFCEDHNLDHAVAVANSNEGQLF